MMVLEFAQKTDSYKSVHKQKVKWKGYTVYAPNFDDGRKHYIGLPYFILVDDEGKMRWTEPDECLDCLDFLIKNDPDPDDD